jgi:hypothetical protein
VSEGAQLRSRARALWGEAADLRADAARLEDLAGRVRPLLDGFAAAAAGRRRMDRLTALLGDSGLTILGYDGADDGRLILALGDVERAEVISTVIPGTGTTLDGLHASSDYRTYVANLQRELGDGHATVLWFDFDAPDDVLPGAARSRYADDAALRLPAFTEGLAVPNDARQAVSGHSYGGVVLATAGPQLHAADTVVALGAPGMRVLGTQAPPFPDGTRVVAATYPRDPILHATIVPRWGIDPVQHRGVDVIDLTTIDQSGKSAVQRHTDYLLDDVSLAIFGAIVRGEDVELRHAGSSGER